MAGQPERVRKHFLAYFSFFAYVCKKDTMQTGHHTYVIQDKYKSLEPFVRSLPEVFERQGTTIYKARNELKAYHTEGLDLIVKSFRKPIFINRIIYGFFRASKAERSYKHALKMLGNGIPTPEPVAYIEEKEGGLLNRSYYVSIFEKDYSEIRSQMLGKDADDVFIRSLARLVADLHKKGILQKDLSPGNILTKQEGEQYKFMLVDINRARFSKQLSARQRYRNFKRISENKDIIGRLAAEYASAMHEDKDMVLHEIEKYVAGFSKNYRL